MRKTLLITLLIFSIALNSPFLCSADEFNLNLKRGLNFISIPVSLSSTFIQNVLLSIKDKYTDIWSYDKTNPTDPWKHYNPYYVQFSDLLNIESGKNYWIEASNDCILTLNGTPLSNNSFIFTPGWNTLSWQGLQSQSIQIALYPLVLGTDYSHIFRFDPQTQTFQEYSLNQFDTFEPGQSYYVYALKNCSTINLPLPQITITTPTDNAFLNTPNINVKGTVNNDNITVQVNGVLATVSNKEFSVIIPLNEGENIIEAIASNQNGNTDTDTINVTLDTIPPGSVKFFGTIGKITNNPSWGISGRKEAWTSVWINDKEEVPNDSSSEWIYFASLTEGENTFSIIVRDKAGNESKPYILTITLDTVLPQPPTVDPVTTPTNQNTQNLTGTKEVGTSVWINYNEVISFNQDTTWSHTVTLFDEGGNSFRVTAKDRADNESYSKDYIIIILDTTAPTAPVFDEITPIVGSASQVISGQKEAWASIWINGKEEVPFDSSETWSYTATLVEGENTFSAVAKDKAGNESLPTTLTVTLSTTAPDTAAPVVKFLSPLEGSVVTGMND